MSESAELVEAVRSLTRVVEVLVKLVSESRVVSSYPTRYECPVRECPAWFSHVDSFDAHMKMVHS